MTERDVPQDDEGEVKLASDYGQETYPDRVMKNVIFRLIQMTHEKQQYSGVLVGRNPDRWATLTYEVTTERPSEKEVARPPSDAASQREDASRTVS